METYFQNYVTKVHLQNPFKFPLWVQCPNVTGISIQLSKLLITPHEAGNTYQLKLHNLNLVFPKFPFIQYHVNYQLLRSPLGPQLLYSGHSKLVEPVQLVSLEMRLVFVNFSAQDASI